MTIGFLILSVLCGLLSVLVILMACYLKNERMLFKKLVSLQQETAEKLAAVTKPLKKTETAISIDKDEPLAKYKTVVLPDDIQISFIEKEGK